MLDKPPGVSSAGAVHRVKLAARAARCGHGGTLDPLATGVLPICLGAATKLAAYLLAEDKAYEAEGILGVETDTLDRTGEVTRTRPEAAAAVTREALLAAIAGRRGEHAQLPPMYSAIKQGGVRLYERARAGEDVERAVRQVRIDELELLAFAPPRFRVAVACSKGTYIRSLIADLGEDLGCGAHLTELRRTRSGRFGLAQAVTLEDVEALAARGELAARLVDMAAATDLPRITVDEAMLAPIRNGLQMEVAALGPPDAPIDGDLQRFQILGPDGRVVAVAHGEGGRVIYDRVFAEHLPPATAGSGLAGRGLAPAPAAAPAPAGTSGDQAP